MANETPIQILDKANAAAKLAREAADMLQHSADQLGDAAAGAAYAASGGAIDPFVFRHSVAARPVLACNITPRQCLRHGRHGDCHCDHASLPHAGRALVMGSGDCRHRHWRWHRCMARTHCADDRHAATGRLLPRACRPCCRARCSRRALRTAGFRHRHQRIHPWCKPLARSPSPARSSPF